MNKDWTHPNSHKNANNKNKLRGELEIQMNKFLHVFCDIVNDIPSFEFFSNLFFHQLAKKILFQYFRWFFSGSYGRIYWGDRIGRSRRSETQWPRRRQQGATTCARSRFLLSLPQSFFPVNNEFRFVGASFFFCCHFLGRLRKKHLHFFQCNVAFPEVACIFLLQDSYLVLDKLPPEYDSRVKAMEVQKLGVRPSSFLTWQDMAWRGGENRKW